MRYQRVVSAAVLALSGLLLTSASAAGEGNEHPASAFWLAEETESTFVTREGEEFGPDSPFELTADLSGANEVDDQGNPGAGDPDGTGTAAISLHVDNIICWTLSVENVQLPAIAAHIHVGEAGENGDVVMPLSAPALDGAASGCTQVPEELTQAIAENPAGYYVNVHTSEFPAGAVRGQLEGSFEDPRPGDRFFLAEDLFASDASGTKGDRIGSTLIQCTFGLANSLQCSGTASLDGRGQVHVTATIVFDPTSEESVPFDIAIVGGTGEFADAGGDATLTELTDTEPFQTLWEVRLLHLG